LTLTPPSSQAVIPSVIAFAAHETSNHLIMGVMLHGPSDGHQ